MYLNAEICIEYFHLTRIIGILNKQFKTHIYLSLETVLLETNMSQGIKVFEGNRVTFWWQEVTFIFSLQGLIRED